MSVDDGDVLCIDESDEEGSTLPYHVVHPLPCPSPRLNRLAPALNPCLLARRKSSVQISAGDIAAALQKRYVTARVTSHLMPPL